MTVNYLYLTIIQADLWVIILLSACLLALIILLGLCIFYIFRRKRKNEKDFDYVGTPTGHMPVPYDSYDVSDLYLPHSILICW